MFLRNFLTGAAICAAGWLCLNPPMARALDRLSYSVTGPGSDLRAALKSASALQSAVDDKRTGSQNLFSAALADYRNLTETLYAAGYYSGTVSIRIDGREAADIPLLTVPAAIGQIAVRVTTGRPFRFGAASIAPLAPGSALPEAFRSGQPAESTVIRDAVAGAVADWREAGRAQTRVADETIVADHGAQRLDARVILAPGPVVSFGKLSIATPSQVSEDAIRRIAGFPSGARFSDSALTTVAGRLRRTGAFGSVTLTEAGQLGPGNSIDVDLSLSDAAPRHLSFGAELSTEDGVAVTGSWMHRNFLGGAENFLVDGAVSNIGGTGGGVDYHVGARLERPAMAGPDTVGFAHIEFDHANEPDYLTDTLVGGIGLRWLITDLLNAEVGVDLSYSDVTDDLGSRQFTLLSVPAEINWDRRNNALDPTAGFYLGLEARPFLALAGGDSGFRALVDGRYYRSFGAADRLTLATRLRVGTVAGVGITRVDPSYLFFSGGGGTVRGQPYQSLNVDLGGGNQLGGRSFVGLSGEVRARIAGAYSGVAFYDAGYIGAESFADGSGAWHSGAGLGLRYDTGLGPIRVDVAAPVGGTTGHGVQVYIGIGQAF